VCVFLEEESDVCVFEGGDWCVCFWRRRLVCVCLEEEIDVCVWRRRLVCVFLEEESHVGWFDGCVQTRSPARCRPSTTATPTRPSAT
jgi:hypothetical protein